jgi:hypothetical protein
VSGRRTLLWLLLFALALGLNGPYLRSGFTADEILIVDALEEDPLPYSRWRGAWSGSTEDLSWFGNPWWSDPGAIGGFFRPLPSLLLEASVRLFGRVAFPLHLVFILLHGLIAVLLLAVLHRIAAHPRVPALAALAYVVCEDHSMTVGFISFGTDILCVLFICLALLAHLEWLRSRRRRFLLLSLLATVAAFGSKETAAAAPLVLAATSFFFPHGRAEDGQLLTRESLAARWSRFVHDPASWAPALALLLAFLGAYRILDLGGMNNLTYLDPVAHPGRYLSHLALHLPVMWLATFTPVLPGITMFQPDLLPWLAGAGVLVGIGLLFGMARARRSPLAVWAFGLYLVALLPQLGADASERLLYLPYVFAAVLIAMPLASLGTRPSPLPGEDGRRGSLAARLAGGYFALLLLSGAVLSALLPSQLIAGMRPYLTDPSTAAPHVSPENTDVVILNARDGFAILLTPTLLRDQVEADANVTLLSAHPGRFTLERAGDASFLLRTDRQGWLTDFFPRMFRSEVNLTPGRVYPGPLFDATLVELTADGTDALAVRFEFHRPLADETIRFLYWDRRTFRPLALHELAPGESMRLNSP